MTKMGKDIRQIWKRLVDPRVLPAECSEANGRERDEVWTDFRCNSESIHGNLRSTTNKLSFGHVHVRRL